jgi:dipeptidase
VSGHEPRVRGTGGVSPLLLSAGLVAATVLPCAAQQPGAPPRPEPSLWTEPLPTKSIAIYVGRDLTDDGSVLLGGFGHEPSSHWYEITPARTFPPGTTVEVGITEEARIPGERFRIPQVERTLRYITTNYSEFAGFPPPLTNGGLNERHVAARDVWSPSRPELRALTPVPQTGLNYSDLSRIAMERAGSAREAAEIVGRLIEQHGYATYGGNSHLFADANEGWVLIDYAGGQGLWAAERLGPDEVRVLYPGHIDEFPVDFRDDPDFMGSDHIVDFAVERGWWDPGSGEPFDLHEVYGQPYPSEPGQDDPHTLFRYPPMLEQEIAAMAPVSLVDMMALVRDPRWSNDGSGYGQVAHLRADTPTELGTLWMSITGAVASPFVPVPLGARDVPPEYKQHRYMTKDADDDFLDTDYAPLEATRSAFRVHKRLLYHMCEHPEDFLGPVTAELEAFEDRVVGVHADLTARAADLLEAGDEDAVRTLLTEATRANLLDALALGERLVARVEADTRDTYGVRLPTGDVVEGGSWRPESEPMTQRPGQTYHRCYRAGLGSYPRRHGSFAELVGTLIGPDMSRPGPGDRADRGWAVLGLLLGFAAGLVAGRLLGRAA